MNLRLYRDVRRNQLNPETDEQLVHAILSGDLDRFGVIVSRHDALVRQCVARRISDHEAMEEAVQETWCQSFRRLGDLVQPQKLAGWLRKIATNCALEQGRKQKAILSLPLTSEVPAVKAAEDAGWIWELIDTMPHDQAIVLKRHYLDGQSYDEIARTLELKRSTVRGRIYSARQELKRRIGDQPWQFQPK